MLPAFLLGALASFVAGLPVSGPAAALVADAAMHGERRRAVGIGVGAAVPEAGWAFVAWLGVGSALAGRPGVEAVAHGLAGVVLLGVAGALWRRGPANRPPTTSGVGPAAWIGALATAFNPTLALTWGTVAAAIVGTGLGEPGLPGALGFGIGVGVGAVAATLVLVHLASHAHTRLPERTRLLMARGVAGLLAALGIAALAGALA